MLRLYRAGPIVMLVPVAAWAIGWHIGLGSHAENQSWYIVWPMFGFIGLAALWHIALLLLENKRRYLYLAYAIVHMPLFCFATWLAMIYATRFPL